jgi:23S rRNA pseudouridine1911/1915/1917 synthase
MSSYQRVGEKESPSPSKGRELAAAVGRVVSLDARVRGLFGFSWGRARDLVRRGKVKVRGKVVTDPTAKVPSNVEIDLDLAARNARAAARDLPKEAIVHVDPHIVVVDKPAGISTVPFDEGGMGASIAKRTTHREETTLDERVRLALAKKSKRGGPPPEIGVVHRLDKETSGLLVFTRTWAAKRVLLQAFRFHHVHRVYLALVHGAARAGTITSHFVEDRGDGLRGSVERRHGRKHAVGSEKTQRAVTHVEVVEKLDGASLVACRLETGRTHQIRIHLSEAGHPVVGERVYIRDFAAVPIPAPRLMLHAAELGFEHPVTGRAMSWRAEIPADMAEVLERLRGRSP